MSTRISGPGRVLDRLVDLAIRAIDLAIYISVMASGYLHLERLWR